jgi:hypothetical protein
LDVAVNGESAVGVYVLILYENDTHISVRGGDAL